MTRKKKTETTVAVKANRFKIGSVWKGNDVKRDFQGRLLTKLKRTPGMKPNIHRVCWSDSKCLKIGCYSVNKTTWGKPGTCSFKIHCTIKMENGEKVLTVVDRNFNHCSVLCPFKFHGRTKVQESSSEAEVNGTMQSKIESDQEDGEGIVGDYDDDDDDDEFSETSTENDFASVEGRKRLPPLNIVMYGNKGKMNKFEVVRGATAVETFKRNVETATHITISTRTAQRYKILI